MVFEGELREKATQVMKVLPKLNFIERLGFKDGI